jgi:hypothetical protein
MIGVIFFLISFQFQVLIPKKRLDLDAHGLKTQGRGYLKLLPKSEGGLRVLGKISRGPHYSGICFMGSRLIGSFV